MSEEKRKEVHQEEVFVVVLLHLHVEQKNVEAVVGMLVPEEAVASEGCMEMLRQGGVLERCIGPTLAKN